MKSNKLSNLKVRNEFANLMYEIGKKDSKLVVLVGDISHGILDQFRNSFPERYYNIGILEPSMVNISAGLSKLGLRPVIHTIAPFLIERSYEQIKLDFGYQNLPVNIISVGGSFDYSKLGCSHHCYTDVSLMSHFKNSIVITPGSNIEFRELFKQIYKGSTINYFRLPENSHDVKFNPKDIKLGKSIKIKSGKDITLITHGGMLRHAQKAAELCKKEKINVELIYCHTLKPFDSKTLVKSLKKTKKLISVEDLSMHDGLFNLCTKSIANVEIKNIKLKQLAIEDFIHDYGSFDDLCKKAKIDYMNIYKQIKKMI